MTSDASRAWEDVRNLFALAGLNTGLAEAQLAQAADELRDMQQHLARLRNKVRQLAWCYETTGGDGMDSHYEVKDVRALAWNGYSTQADLLGAVRQWSAANPDSTIRLIMVEYDPVDRTFSALVTVEN